MNNTIRQDGQYVDRINTLRPVIQGHYELIAARSGKSYATVMAVMNFKFRNKKVLHEAERLYKYLSKVYTKV